MFLGSLHGHGSHCPHRYTKEQSNQNPFQKQAHTASLTSFAVGITNPAAILTFLFAFSWFGIAGGSTKGNGWLVVLGVFLGTWLWWGGLTAAVSLVRKKKRKGEILSRQQASVPV